MANVPEVRKLGLAVLKPSAVPLMSYVRPVIVTFAVPAEPRVVAAGEPTDVVDADGFGGELVLFEISAADPRCLITGVMVVSEPAGVHLHRLRGAGVSDR